MVGPPEVKTRRSRYAIDAIDGPRPTAIDANDETLASALLRRAEWAPEPPVVVFDSDEAVDFLARHRGALAPRLRFALPDENVLADLSDKARFQRLAERLALPIPNGRVMRAGDAQTPPGGPAFPLVLKPVPHRGEGWWRVAGSRKVLVAEAQSSLDAILHRLTAEGIDVLAQELIPGSETEVVSYHVYVRADGAVAGEFTGRKIRTYPREHGMSTALTTTDDPAVVALGRDIVERLDLRGAAKLDFKRTPGGDLRLLEVNPRLTLWVHPGAVAGANLAALMYADLTGRKLPPPARGRAGVRWVSMRGDRAAARGSDVPMRRWLPWALRCETNSAFAWRDPGPALARVRVPAPWRRAY